MGKIKKILENELTGGNQSTEVYPVTSIKAVYDENNERLDNIIDRKDNEIQKKLETEVARATNAESNLRETINNITEVNENATVANIVTVDTIPNTSSSNVQQALNELFKNALFAGIATPATNPETPDGPVFYFAAEAGTYSNFNGISVANGEAVVLEWDNGAWTKKVTGFANQKAVNDELSDLEEKTSDISNEINEVYGDLYGTEIIINQDAILDKDRKWVIFLTPKEGDVITCDKFTSETVSLYVYDDALGDAKANVTFDIVNNSITVGLLSHPILRIGRYSEKFSISLKRKGKDFEGEIEQNKADVVSCKDDIMHTSSKISQVYGSGNDCDITRNGVIDTLKVDNEFDIVVIATNNSTEKQVLGLSLFDKNKSEQITDIVYQTIESGESKKYVIKTEHANEHTYLQAHNIANSNIHLKLVAKDNVTTIKDNVTTIQEVLSVERIESIDNYKDNQDYLLGLHLQAKSFGHTGKKIVFDNLKLIDNKSYDLSVSLNTVPVKNQVFIFVYEDNSLTNQLFAWVIKKDNLILQTSFIPSMSYNNACITVSIHEETSRDVTCRLDAKSELDVILEEYNSKIESVQRDIMAKYYSGRKFYDDFMGFNYGQSGWLINNITWFNVPDIHENYSGINAIIEFASEYPSLVKDVFAFVSEGDFFDAGSKLRNDAVNIATKWAEIVSKSPIDVMFCIGGHDFYNHAFGSDTGEELAKRHKNEIQYVFSKIDQRHYFINPCINRLGSKAVIAPNDSICYYYVDDIKNSHRFIMLDECDNPMIVTNGSVETKIKSADYETNTFVGMNGVSYNMDSFKYKYDVYGSVVYSQAQIDWLVSTLLASNGKFISVFNHSGDGSINTLEPNTQLYSLNNSTKVIFDILCAFVNRTTFSYNSHEHDNYGNSDNPIVIDVDFTNCTGVITGLYYGHIHHSTNSVYKTTPDCKGFNVISFTNISRASGSGIGIEGTCMNTSMDALCLRTYELDNSGNKKSLPEGERLIRTIRYGRRGVQKGGSYSNNAITKGTSPYEKGHRFLDESVKF